ncbi:MAG: TetR/AcrR family transcriptional regulator, partial [Bryobacteraceae bacterium]
MKSKAEKPNDGLEPHGPPDRHLRADARRNLDALLKSAVEVFEASGVDAPVREIAEKAGVGIGTVYRHFPKRSDLIAAVFRHEIDACADAAPRLAAKHGSVEALTRWMQRYAAFIATKRRLAPALHSGDPAFESLRAYFLQRLKPALQTLLESAAAAGEIRTDIDSKDLLSAIASLCMSAENDRPNHTRRMLALLVDGLRYGKRSP